MPRILTATGLPMSRLGLGTVQFGRTEQLKYPRKFELPSYHVLEDLIDEAQHRGINWVDTAPAYGFSEERLGKLLLYRRKHFIISTKVGEEFENGVSRCDLSLKHTRMSIERSLRRLRTDYLDIVLVHCDATDEILDCLYHFKKLGFIRYVGVSVKNRINYNVDVLMLTPDRINEAGECVVLIKKPLSSGYARDPEQTLKTLFQNPIIDAVVLGTLDRKHLIVASSLNACITMLSCIMVFFFYNLF